MIPHDQAPTAAISLCDRGRSTETYDRACNYYRNLGGIISSLSLCYYAHHSGCHAAAQARPDLCNAAVAVAWLPSYITCTYIALFRDEFFLPTDHDNITNTSTLPIILRPPYLCCLRFRLFLLYILRTFNSRKKNLRARR